MTAALAILPDPPREPTLIGLIAGGGQLPSLIAEGLRRDGHSIMGLGLAGQYEADLPGMCREFREVGLLRVGTWGPIMAKRGIRHAIMVGRVDKAKFMYDPLKLVRNVPDVRTAVAWFHKLRHDRRSSALLSAIAEELDRHGVALMDSTAPIPDQLSTTGVMTRRKPSDSQQADIDFVWPFLNELLRLDIGQAMAVKDRDVIAVEAVEGTDRMIERTGQLCRSKGWVLCKGARAGHDRRADVPTVGERTIEKMAEAGAGCLALATGDVIMIDREAMIAKADSLGISIVGVPTARSMGIGSGPGTGSAGVSPVLAATAAV
ncbi:MAG: UDP-2,3-diacylglucosamine diphosphatase LpxI [Planctomycetota bacterium]